MSKFSPISALSLLQQNHIISFERARALSENSSPLILCQAMSQVENSELFLETLSAIIADIDERTQAIEARNQEIKADPRYASAPKVTGTFVRQHEEPEGQILELGRTSFTIPLTYLVEHRAELGTAVDNDADAIAYDLGLVAGHDGPFEVTDVEESIAEWLAATE